MPAYSSVQVLPIHHQQSQQFWFYCISGMAPLPHHSRCVSHPQHLSRPLVSCTASSPHALAVRRREVPAFTGGGGGAMPSAFCCMRIWPMRSPRLEPTWRPTSLPLR